MDSDKTIIFLLAIILTIVTLLGIQMFVNSRQTISGGVVETLNPQPVFYNETIEEPEEVIEEVQEENVEENESEEIIEEIEIETFEDNYPIEIKFKTFKVFMGESCNQASIVDGLEPECKEFLKNEKCPIIVFENDKDIDYNEVRDFLQNNEINLLVGVGNDAVEIATNIRKSTGVNVMIRFANSARTPTESISELEPLPC